MVFPSTGHISTCVSLGPGSVGHVVADIDAAQEVPGQSPRLCFLAETERIPSDKQVPGSLKHSGALKTMSIIFLSPSVRSEVCAFHWPSQIHTSSEWTSLRPSWRQCTCDRVVERPIAAVIAPHRRVPAATMWMRLQLSPKRPLSGETSA